MQVDAIADLEFIETLVVGVIPDAVVDLQDVVPDEPDLQCDV